MSDGPYQTPVTDLNKSLGMFFIEHAAHDLEHAPRFVVSCKTCHHSRSVPQRPDTPEPLPMLLWCPECMERHIDICEFATKPHHTHACQNCGHVWRPAIVPTVGVQFLPGFKNE